ncbi:hypothetical protein K1T71_009054 [Dendrolimus kikuchii]|uniref:Uncharacterized protein n=1 Tax=Dendrolimus kikuchii TaxID=765133 RepID=A0ACC1CWR0_9NEOP|nr:hypothetical protein K1T71_009054 [Dendrolimus kikuchii]
MRSKDRLAELRHLAENSGGVYNDTVEVAIAKDGLQQQQPQDLASDIDALFQEVDRMRGWIHELNGNTQLMRRLHADPTYHNNKHLQEQLDSVITQSNAVGLKVCGALRQFEARASRAERTGRNDATSRIARLQYAATRHLYADALARHHDVLNSVRDYQLSLLHEQIRLTNLTISDEECQSLLDTKNISLFVDNLKAETAEARRALREVEARHEELTRVELSLKEVRELFQQLAHLVAQQQDQIDSVEYYALQATEHVECGGQQLLKGTVSKTKARKKKVSLIICLLVGFLVVLLVLIIT